MQVANAGPGFLDRDAWVALILFATGSVLALVTDDVAESEV
jgi:hypothetical protein